MSTDVPRLKAWVRGIIGDATPLQIYTAFKSSERVVDNRSPDAGCIINSPASTMANELIGIDMSTLMNNVLTSAAIQPDHRNKPLLAIVRGPGGGKTRCFEEIRRDLLVKENSLPIAITFNLRTRAVTDVKSWCIHSNFQVAAALSIIVRMMYAVFGPIEGFHTWIIAIQENLHLLDACGKVSGQELIRATSSVIVEMVSEYRPIHTLVVLIDESLQLETELLSAFPHVSDPLDVVRSAFLDEKITPTINTALIMSSLRISCIGLTSSSRSVTPIVLPDHLDPLKVVDTWLCMDGVSTGDRDRLLLLAAAMNNLPRALQYLKESLEQQQTNQLGADWIYQVVKATVEQMQVRYSPFFPSARLFYHIVFQDVITLDDEVAAAIQSSVVTNSLDRFNTDRAVQFVPQASLALLMTRVVDSDVDPRRDSNTDALRIIHSAVESMLKVPSPAGDILENIFSSCLRLRAIAAKSNFKTASVTTTLAKYTGLSAEMNLRLRPELLELMQRDLNFHFVPRIHKIQTSCRNENRTSNFIAELAEIGVSAVDPVVVISAAKGAAFDVAIKVYTGKDTEPIFFVWEMKSSGEKYKDGRKKQRNKMFVERTQYKHFRNVVRGRVPFVYIYATTHAEQASLVEGEEFACVVMGKWDTLKFLGPFADIYQVARNIANKPRAKRKQ